MATHTDVYSAHPGQPIGRPAAEHMGSMLEQLTAQMQTRFADVERRHADALHELQAKLERMSGAASKARPAMPAELAGAFQRVEAGMADLVDRIAEVAPERRRGAEAFVFGAVKPESSHFVFDPPRRDPVAPVAFDAGAAGEPWDLASAEALARLYESGEALLVKHLPEAALFAPGQWARQHEVANRTEPAAMPTQIEEMPAATRHSAAVVAAGLGDDRQWLDQRLADISEHISKSVGDARPDAALNTLMSRVDQLESRFSCALEGIAKTTDVAALRADALKQVELQIGELAGHIEVTRQQLTRLDAIEQHLSDLTAYAHAAMDADGAATNAAPDMTHDFAQLADLAVERALSRAPVVTGEAVAPTETQARMEAVHALLQEFAAERRRGDQYTSGMLETVQEALVRLIDRVDAIDGAVNRVPDLSHPSAVVSSQAAQVATAPPIVATLAPDTPPMLTDEPVETSDRSKLRRRARTSEQQSGTASATTSPSDLENERIAQPEISIKDLKLSQRNTRAIAPSATADEKAPADAAAIVESAPKQGRSARAPSAQPAATGGGSRRALYVAAAALSLVGIGFMAQHLYSGGSADPSAASVTAAPARAPLAADLNKAATIAPAPVAGSPVSPATRPPGMVTAPRTESTALPSVTVVPSSQAGSPPAGQRQEPVQPRRLDAPAVVVPGQPRGPASIPETVSDDLSMIDVEDNNSVIAPASTPGAPRPEPSGRSLATLQPLQGLAIAGGPTMTSPQQISDFTGLQRQSRQAAASEQVGFNARPASDFSQRFGTNPPAPAAAAAAATPANQGAAIVTGSTTVPRATPDTSLVDAVPETADLPPALVGPLSLRMAAAKGEPSAAFEVATRFAEGRGIKQDFKQAMVWYQRSAGKGFAIAQYRLGTLYERGLGTPVDVARARVWYKRAADQGNVKAMHNMAVLSAGNGQAAPDYAGAAKWFKEAADRGLADSQFNLGVLYENGLGIEKDPSTAYVWFSLAARNGDVEAVRRRDQLLASLDAEAVRIANDRVQNWHARATNSKVNDARVAGDQWRSQSAQLEEAVPQVQPSPFAGVGNPAPAPRTVKAPTPAR